MRLLLACIVLVGQTAQPIPVYPPSPVVGDQIAPPPKIEGPLRVGGDIAEPHKTKHVDPKYPKSARGVTGAVIVEILIGTNGRVRDVRVLRSSPPFDKAAIAAVKQWRYEPTRLGGTSVAILMNQTIRFTPPSK